MEHIAPRGTSILRPGHSGYATPSTVIAAPFEDHQRHIDLAVDVRRNAVPCGQSQQIDVQLPAVHTPDWPVSSGLAKRSGDIDSRSLLADPLSLCICGDPRPICGISVLFVSTLTWR